MPPESESRYLQKCCPKDLRNIPAKGSGEHNKPQAALQVNSILSTFHSLNYIKSTVITQGAHTFEWFGGRDSTVYCRTNNLHKDCGLSLGVAQLLERSVRRTENRSVSWETGGKRPLGRPRRRWEDNIKMDLREVGYDDRDWINLAQDRDRWRAYVRAAMNLRVPEKPFVISEKARARKPVLCTGVRLVCVRICVSIRRPEFECSGPQLEGPEFECSGPQLRDPSSSTVNCL
ncbi:hypothetical protein ANN_00900 [Periplaneta americana]|uniref:Uncharacterized protein n=1 Tax=Periplaneta americana TaxID=6978 RepID=A0ABQ8TS49_PERAM|nr:hypothetical protein ANN_00900 [Periplaneta americana]